MRRALRLCGNVLLATSLLGLVGIAVLELAPEEVAPVTAIGSHGVTLPWASIAAPVVGAPTVARSRSQGSSAFQPTSQPEVVRTITRVAIPSIELSAEVVPSDLVPLDDGGVTWQVPAFKVGHAAGSAGAGEVGNAILLGHVTSLHSGNVFQELERVNVGDEVQVFSGDDGAYKYRVVSTKPVSRTDSDVLQPTATPSVSLITCTGVWLPTIWDYTERLVVRAELSR